MAEANRREHPRYPLELDLEVRDRSSGPTSVVSGVTVNVSRGGILALLDDEISVGPETDCLVRFMNARGLVEPAYRWGKALRSAKVDAGYEVAIQFAALIDVSAQP